MNILVPPGIGDIFWTLLKLKDIYEKHGDGKGIHLKIACWHVDNLESRALSFVSRFDFVDSAEMHIMPRGTPGPILKHGTPADANGYYRYLDDGKTLSYKGIDFIAIPNGTLEQGKNIKNWMPEVDIDYDVIQNNFPFTDEEIKFGDDFKQRFGNYVCLFMASQNGNLTSGHNRNSLWTPKEWIQLGENIHNLYGSNIVVLGANWDETYYEQLIKPHIKSKRHWFNYINQLPIFLTLQVIKNSKALISYQSGLGIVGNYLHTPVAMWWRPYGNSIDPYNFVSFHEDMSHCWTKPGVNYLPCIYGKHGVPEIMEWLKNIL